MRHRLLATVSVPVLAILSAPAFAQGNAAAPPAPPTSAESNEIIVTGLRASQERAVETKKEAEEIVEAVSAEDIGKLPDNNIAEAIQRLTGVQIGIFAGGEGGQAFIRGIQTTPGESPIRVELNGQSTGGGGRDAGIAELPASLVSSIVVFKTPAADQVEGQLAGTIKLKTLRPGQIKRLTANASLRGTYYDYNEDVGGFASAFIGNAWEFGDAQRIGFTLSGSYNKYSLTHDRIGTGNNIGTRWRGSASQRVDVDGDGVVGEAIDDIIRVPQQFVLDTFDTDIEQGFVNGQIGFEASPELSFTASAIYNFTKSDQRTELLQAPSLYNSRADTATPFIFEQLDGITIYDTALNDFRPAPSFRSGTFSLTQINSMANTARLDYNSLNLSAEMIWDTDHFLFELSAGYKKGSDKSWRNQAVLNVIDSTGTAVTGGTFPDVFLDFTTGNEAFDLAILPSTSARTLDLLDPYYYRLNNISSTDNRLSSEEKNVEAGFAYKLDNSFFRTFEIGGRLTEETYERNQFNQTLAGARIANSLQRLTNFDSYWEYAKAGDAGPFLSAVSGNFPRDWITPSVPFGPPGSDWYGPTAGSADIWADLPFNFTASYGLKETTEAAYLLTRFGNADTFISGNAGVRYVHTGLLSEGNETLVDGSIGPISIRRNYDNWLPSANISLNFDPDLRLRLAAFKAMVRPNLQQLRAARSVEYDNNGDRTSATGGNPYLKAQTAFGLDASAEYYFRRGSYVSAGVFYRELYDKIATTFQQVTITDDDQIIFDGTGPVRYTSPINVDGTTKMYGFEAAFVSNLFFLPGFWQDFGVNLNYNYVQSKDPDNPDTPYRDFFTNITPHTFNAQVFYEKGGFATRVAWNYRGKTVKSTNLTPAPDYDRLYAIPESRIDMSMSYDVTRQVQVQLNVKNVFNWRRKLYLETREQFGLTTDDSSQISLGVRWRL